MTEETKCKPVSGWISCSERLPKVWQDVLYGIAPLRYVVSGCMDENGAWWARGTIGQFVREPICGMVTHWQLLPEPPAGKDLES